MTHSVPLSTDTPSLPPSACSQGCYTGARQMASGGLTPLPLPCTFRLQENAEASPGAFLSRWCSQRWPRAAQAPSRSLLSRDGRFPLSAPSLTVSTCSGFSLAWANRSLGAISPRALPASASHPVLIFFVGSKAQSPPLGPGMRLRAEPEAGQIRGVYFGPTSTLLGPEVGLHVKDHHSPAL